MNGRAQRRWWRPGPRGGLLGLSLLLAGWLVLRFGPATPGPGPLAVGIVWLGFGAWAIGLALCAWWLVARRRWWSVLLAAMLGQTLAASLLRFAVAVLTAPEPWLLPPD